MKDFDSLCSLAEKCRIPVIPFPLPQTGSMCVQEDNDRCYIGIDEDCLETETEKTVHLAHELGHCCTGSFYNRYAALDIRQKHENRADKWAIEELISRKKLDRAISEGHTELWDLADYFDVTEDFMRKALCWYKHGNLAVDAYM